MIDPLAAVRAIHFASTIVVAGAATFSVLVAEPVWQARIGFGHALAAHRKHVAYLIWVGLAVAFASGMVWLVLIAVEIADQPFTEVLRNGTAWTVLTATQFGLVSQLRLLLTGILLGLLLMSQLRQEAAPTWLRVALAVLAMAFLGALAWTGHASGAVGSGASAHQFADVVHVLAAGVWIGGLAPLALLLVRLSQTSDGQAMCAVVLRRFSHVGVVTVAALFVTGVINTWFLTARLRCLIGTDYGQLVQIKVALFLAMVGLAADNRLRLLPRIAQAEDKRRLQALRQLRRNTVFEIILGLAVIYVVGVLGMTPPAGHVHGASDRFDLKGSSQSLSGVRYVRLWHELAVHRSARFLPVSGANLPSRDRCCEGEC